jgi:hypothetical protein
MSDGHLGTRGQARHASPRGRAQLVRAGDVTAFSSQPALLHDPELASYLRIEERELEVRGEN